MVYNLFSFLYLFTGQALCGTCRDETHRAKMFSKHDIIHMSMKTKENAKKVNRISILYLDKYQIRISYLIKENLFVIISCMCNIFQKITSFFMKILHKIWLPIKLPFWSVCALKEFCGLFYVQAFNQKRPRGRKY